MQKKISIRIVALISAAFCLLGYGVGENHGVQQADQNTYHSGYQEGYEFGKKDKQKELADFQYTSADVAESYEKGKSEGYHTGYQKGFDTGYSAGESLAQSASDPAPAAPAAKTGTGSSNTGTEQSQSVTVYVTKTGSKYHRPGCQYLKKSCIAISLSEAKAEGYTACSRCW